MKEPNSILIEQQPINNLYLNDTIDRPGINGQGIRSRQAETRNTDCDLQWCRWLKNWLDPNLPELHILKLYQSVLKVDQKYVSCIYTLQTSPSYFFNFNKVVILCGQYEHLNFALYAFLYTRIYFSHFNSRHVKIKNWISKNVGGAF